MAGNGLQHVVLDLPEEELPLGFISCIQYAVVTEKSDFTLENSQVEWYIWNQYLSVLENLRIGSVAVVCGSCYNKFMKPTHQNFTVIIAKQSPDSDNRLKIVCYIVQEMYKKRGVFLTKDQDVLQLCLMISELVVKQNLKEFQPFFEACRRNWVSELDEDEYLSIPHRFIQDKDIIERIVKDVLKLAWPF